MFTLETVTTEDDLVIHGLFFKGDISKPVIIHIHGCNANFYTAPFIHSVADKLQKENIGFLSIETRGTGVLTEFYTSVPEKGKVVGSRIELLEEAYRDIDPWMEFLRSQGYKDIILQGHSLGTLKAVRYLFQGKYSELVEKLVLLSVFDSVAQIEKITNGKVTEYVATAEKMIQEGKGTEIIPPEYDFFTFSYQTYAN